MAYSYIIASAEIKNDQGEYLKIKTNKINDWTYPGGKVEIGENPRDAVIREVKEELGVDVEVVEATGFNEFYWESDKAYWLEIIYSTRIVRGIPKIMEPEKILKLQWHNL